MNGLKVVGSIVPHEPCYWIRDIEEVDAVLNLPIRVQYICIRRDGEQAVYPNPLDLVSAIGAVNVPPILFLAGGMSVERAQEHVEQLRMTKRTNPPPIPIQINGETYVDADHPALEVIPNGHNGASLTL